jgi:hypothetical protein
MSLLHKLCFLSPDMTCFHKLVFFMKTMTNNRKYQLELVMRTRRGQQKRMCISHKLTTIVNP